MKTTLLRRYLRVAIQGVIRAKTKSRKAFMLMAKRWQTKHLKQGFLRSGWQWEARKRLEENLSRFFTERSTVTRLDYSKRAPSKTLLTKSLKT